MTAPLTIERRNAPRYALRLPVTYSADKTTGRGWTVDLSSSGVLFTAEHAVWKSSVVLLNIEWPALLDDIIRLRLSAMGRVARTNGYSVAVRFTRIPSWKTMGRAKST